MMFPDFGKPFTLGSDVFVDNLHAREGVHIDGDSLESTLATKQNTLTGTSDVPGLDDALADKQRIIQFSNSALPSQSLGELVMID